MVFPYINVINQPQNAINAEKICKDFEDIFSVIKVDDHQQKRKIFKNSLVYLNIGDALETMDNWYIYNIHNVHKAISQFLVKYL